MKPACLGGLSPRRFLREHWQKKPLLIRQAFPGFGGLIDKRALFRLAGDETAETRLIRQKRSGWHVEHGPFSPAVFAKLPERDWTLLLQDLNHHLLEAARLLQAFDFIPHARVDDVMVSYAVASGGVGPHVDSYDVFLLQGSGRRRWQISAQKNQELVADAPLKILRDFRSEQEWVLDPGDMLYLPPGYAHNGTAVNECTTYSIGFRAPSMQELAYGFLGHLQDRLAQDGMYADPDLTATSKPGEIPSAMVRKVTTLVDSIRWQTDDVTEFLGIYLSEPKPHVFFSTPRRALSQTAFASALAKRELRLALKSRMLYRGRIFYLNGEPYQAPAADLAWLSTLADRRCASVAKISAETAAQLYDWYRAGFVELAVAKSDE